MKRSALKAFIKLHNMQDVSPSEKMYHISLGTIYHSAEYKAHVDAIYEFFGAELLPDDDYFWMETDTAHFKVMIEED